MPGALADMVTPDRGMLVGTDEHGRYELDVGSLRQALVEEPALRSAHASAARAWAEAQTHDALAARVSRFFTEAKYEGRKKNARGGGDARAADPTASPYDYPAAEPTAGSGDRRSIA